MLNPGQILDEKYEIIKVLGRGGMGTVYLCKNNRLGNFWALKEVNGQWKDKIDFLAEPNLLKDLSHIGIVRIIDIFYEYDNLYIVEDYIEGKTLKEHVVANGALSSERVTDISLQLCSILGYLHSFNPPIIYRDLKPSNIMIKPNKKVVLIDFGIARTYKENQEGDTMILGSMGYIAPEQLINAQSNAQTDIYSLGVTMFFMLTGKSINLPSELIFEENFRSDANKNLIMVIQKASAIDTKNRYSDVLAMHSELNANIPYGEYEKTMFMNLNEAPDDTTKAVLLDGKRLKKKTKLIIIAVLVCIMALVVLIALIMNNKAADKDASTGTKTTKAVVTKVEKDTIIKGMLDMKNSVILSSGSRNIKDKGNDKHKGNQLVQFTLNPAAAISNAKLSVSLTNIQVIDKDVTAILSIKNTADAGLKLDLSKTYLENDQNEAIKSYNLGSASMLPISQTTNTQEIKLYFKELQFDEGSYILKTVLSSSINKDINLSFDVKK